MSNAALMTLSLHKRAQTAESKPVPLSATIRALSDKDSSRLVYERHQLEGNQSQHAKLLRELELCQERIAEYESKGVDTRAMVQRWIQRELRDKLTLFSRKIERQADAVMDAQKHQDDWYAMRTAVHQAWGFALGQDFLSEGLDQDRWSAVLIAALHAYSSKCTLALRGFELLNGSESCDAAAREEVRELWGGRRPSTRA